MQSVRRPDEDFVRRQSARSDKENSGLSRIAIQTAPNFPRSTGTPPRLMENDPIIRQAQAVERGKVRIISNFFPPNCTGIVFESV